MLTPLKNKVLIDPDGKITETESGLSTGLYSLELALRRGTVVSVGSGTRDVKVGDRVCWTVEQENDIEHNNNKYILIDELQIAGIINEE